MVRVLNPDSVLRVQTVAKKRSDSGPKAEAGRPITFRAPQDLAPRLDAVALGLGLDVSNLVRMVLYENLEQYEERVSRLARKKGGE